MVRRSDVDADNTGESLAESADAPSARNRATALNQGERLRSQR